MGLSSATAGDGAQLCVFDLRRGHQEGQELDKILFFHPADCPILPQLSVIGLCEGIITFTRRGIGKQLLKACEDLITKMDAKGRVYLHCRIIDQVPFNMYSKAGYDVVQTDRILVWLSLQKRKHLMCKELPQASVGSECTTKDIDDNILTS